MGFFGGGSKRSLTYEVRADVGNFRKGMGQVRGDMGKTEKATKKSAIGFGKMNSALGAFLVAGAAKQVAQTAFDMGKLAEQADIAGKSAEKVLGPGFESLSDSLERTRKLAGLNTAEFNTMLAQMGLMTEGLGLADDAQAEFISRMFNMASELAAFNPQAGTASDAIDAMNSALKNSFNPLEAFGIKLKAADVQARADELESLNDSLTREQAEVEALAQLIEEKGAPAIGSLAENQDSLAQSTAELSAEWGDLKILLGRFLLPILKFLVKFLTESFKALDRLTDSSTFANTRLGVMTANMKKSLDNILRPYIVAIDFIRRAFDAVVGAVGRFRGAISKIKIPSFLRSGFSFPSFAKGGTVPGPKGQPTPIMAHGGEKISPLGGGGGEGINITVNTGVGDPQEIARKIVELLQVYQRSNGAIPIDTGGFR